MTQQEVQNTLLSASYVAATLTDANLAQLSVGNGEVSWDRVRKLNRNINALTMQYNWEVYESDAIYDCLNDLIGFDTTINSIDPNYQPPSGVIIVTNPQSYLQPVVLKFSDFDPASQQIDDGRTTYINANWKGVNPFMALTSPGLTGLELGVDYNLLVGGGFILLSTGNLPEIYDGQLITVYSYALA